MKKLLAIVLALIMATFVFVGCNQTNSTDPATDEDYEPNMEGLVGIAVYEVPKGEDYPFEFEQKLLKSDSQYYGFNKWEKYYIHYIADGLTNITSKNVVFEEKWENDLKFISLSYSAKREQVYWGYVYDVNEEIYIVATNDLVNFDENNSATKTMNIDGAEVSFTVTYNK